MSLVGGDLPLCKDVIDVFYSLRLLGELFLCCKDASPLPLPKMSKAAEAKEMLLPERFQVLCFDYLKRLQVFARLYYIFLSNQDS